MVEAGAAGRVKVVSTVAVYSVVVEVATGGGVDTSDTTTVVEYAVAVVVLAGSAGRVVEEVVVLDSTVTVAVLVGWASEVAVAVVVTYTVPASGKGVVITNVWGENAGPVTSTKFKV